MIPGGYYLKARKTQESWIAHAPPHVREIWDWLIAKANSSKKQLGDKTIDRGQLLTSYEKITEGLHWMVGYRKERYSKSQCETATKLLTKHGMITTTKTTRGMVVTICNYIHYQNPKNYENHNEISTRTTMEPHENHTIEQEWKNVRKKEETLTSKVDTFDPNPRRCPHSEIIELYHACLPELTRIREWTPARQALLRARWNENADRQCLDWWQQFFNDVSRSDFLMGRVKEWKADLEWLIRPKNFPKVLEGKYSNQGRVQPLTWGQKKELELAELERKEKLANTH